ncbi:hypothetical protein NA56DRAFT_634331 [Hyaloscypha hepaticicola]|uniref:AhpC-TSA-domain-containing protein n=1 Tax=Hyaloscypha hepaticicola TaxID=2082293 RepID=A0A2J6PNA7_9HELO|nr:hypothetical protein NA56DRAFT_634331 [Hyaloscypha hepaticicola]
MSIATDPPSARPESSQENNMPSKPQIDTNETWSHKHSDEHLDNIDSTIEFEGDVNTNNDLPTQATLNKIENLPILDKDGKSLPFKNLYTGPGVTRRVLIIFVRHFFCGNCQEYIRTLTSSITPESLLRLPTPTFICIIGHGAPSLIPMYASSTGCPFPIYADPTKKLYNALGMLRTLNLGSRPEYQRRALGSLILNGFLQSIKQLPFGKTWKGGDYQQVGGEFMFEPASGIMDTPVHSPEDDFNRQLGDKGGVEYSEEKRVTWCHRMRNTRDHAEMEELREVLGLDAVEEKKKAKRRSKKVERKGTGISLGSRTSTLLSRKAELEDGGSSGRQSSEKSMEVK